MSARQRAGGIARQAQIRAVLGENGYRRYQQALARAGGIARQAQLRTALGEAGYCAYQRSLYRRAVQKHGAAKMQSILTSAHERRRCWRITNPTPAEELLHWLALQAGLTSLFGGGAGRVRLGAVSMAHRGVLLLDDLPAFSSRLERLRQILDDRSVTLERAGGPVTLPAAFQLVATMRPCP